MSLLLQTWGAGFYLVSKVLLSRSVGENDRRKTTGRRGWVVYLLGVPAWLVVFALNDNWIAVAVELAGVPSMVLGIVAAGTSLPTARRSRLQRSAQITAIVFVCVGIGYSIAINGGIVEITQIMEFGVTIGFLGGVYRLARNAPDGWLLLALGNISAASLMAVQNQHLMAVQQLVSLIFVSQGYLASSQVRRSEQHRLASRDPVP